MIVCIMNIKISIQKVEVLILNKTHPKLSSSTFDLRGCVVLIHYFCLIRRLCAFLPLHMPSATTATSIPPQTHNACLQPCPSHPPSNASTPAPSASPSQPASKASSYTWRPCTQPSTHPDASSSARTSNTSAPSSSASVHTRVLFSLPPSPPPC